MTTIKSGHIDTIEVDVKLGRGCGECGSPREGEVWFDVIVSHSGETIHANLPTADLLAALDAVPAEDATRWQAAAEENERWADALKDRAEKAEAERDTLAATVARVREAAAIWGEGFRAAVLAAIDPEPFTLPTEAGVRFYAEDPEGDSFVFKTLIGGREPLYIADDDQDQVCNADELTGWQNFRLLDGAE